MWCAATITSRTRRSRSCCIGRSARRRAAVRARAADSRSRQEAVEQASRRDVGDGVRARRAYLPEAMVNFLALLGWSPGAGDRELFTRDELIGAFTLDGISGGNAVFNPEKLDWFNQQHIMRLAPESWRAASSRGSRQAGLWDDSYLGDRHAWFFAVLELLKPRAKRLDEFVDPGPVLLRRDIDYDAGSGGQASARGRDGRASDGARRGVRGACDVRSGVDRSGPARDGGGAWCEGGCAHSRRACRGDGKNGKSGAVRGARAPRPGPGARAARAAAAQLAWLRVPDGLAISSVAQLADPQPLARARGRGFHHRRPGDRSPTENFS